MVPQDNLLVSGLPIKALALSITNQICGQNFWLEDEASFLGVGDEIIEDWGQIFIFRSQVGDVEDAGLHKGRAHAKELDTTAAVVKVIAQVPAKSRNVIRWQLFFSIRK